MAGQDRGNGYGNYYGLWPAEVTEYNSARRECRVSIPPLTDGANEMPWAEIEYPVGARSVNGLFDTEIEILPGDHVWVTFIGGDVRYPIITGCRNSKINNSQSWLRFHQDNIEIVASAAMRFVAGGSSIEIHPDHIYIDAGRIDFNTEHDREFLERIAAMEAEIAELKASRGSD